MRGHIRGKLEGYSSEHWMKAEEGDYMMGTDKGINEG